MISQDFLLKQVCVKGEASNVKYHSSGHLYFTLKDEKAAISCAMFAGKRGGLKFKLEEGLKIVVSGTIDIYEKDGNTRLYAEKITLEGVGELYERFERLKEDLEDRGLFAPEYKRALPKHIKTLGVVTASTGAAVRDIINIAKRRDPGIEILLYPAKVQGEGAAESIEKGIEVLNASRAEVIIVGRGGGSIEDLWAFNEEKVAMAIFNCEKPVISAVGHETDYTIADFVADMRAPTPSAAAELAVHDISHILDAIEDKKMRLDSLILSKIALRKREIEILARSLYNLSPMARLNKQRMRVLQAEELLEAAINKVIDNRKYRLSLLAGRMDALSPLKRMSAGYAYISDEKKHGIKSIDEINKGDMIRIYLKDGSAKARIEETVKNKKD